MAIEDWSDEMIRAFLAEIFSPEDDDPIGTDDLPELSDEDREAMARLGTPEEFIARCMRIAEERANQGTGSSDR